MIEAVGRSNIINDISLIKYEVAKSVDIEERVLEDYSRVFGYTDENLKGKHILDVGAGKHCSFAQEASRFGAKVTILDGQEHMKRDGLIRGLVQYLPFKDNYFDETVASRSLYWIRTGMDKALMEMIRVTRLGGRVQVYPVAFEGDRSDIPLPVDLKRPEELLIPYDTLIINKIPEYSAKDWSAMISKILPAFKFRY